MNQNEIRKKTLKILEEHTNVSYVLIQRKLKIDFVMACEALNWARKERWKEYANLRRELESVI